MNAEALSSEELISSTVSYSVQVTTKTIIDTIDTISASMSFLVVIGLSLFQDIIDES